MQFATVLPRLRRRVASDMKREGLPREKVLATIVSLLEKTLIRVGNAEYANQNKSYGLTTMRRKHVDIKGGTLRFEFTGKSGKQWKLKVEDKRIVAITKRCAEIPGHELFKYLDEEGAAHTVDFGDVNAYIKEISGQDFTAKDFRTWSGGPCGDRRECPPGGTEKRVLSLGDGAWSRNRATSVEAAGTFLARLRF